jgi:protoporphyrinogen oxidase|tara:strand:- start:116 stop:1453 length:1338 start_codon:yes stop_codon:yes gene_type:complete
LIPSKVLIIGAGVSGLSTAALLANENIPSIIYEKSSSVGGRTSTTIHNGHILDNGFHIMPFYKKSKIYEILEKINMIEKLNLVNVYDIAFYDGDKFHKYPKGIIDILQLTLIPFNSRLSLLRILLPMAFTSIEKTEQLDKTSLTEVTKKLDNASKSFFDAVCMLAFADTAENISLGEFTRTIIRANPFKGGTSEFAYPDMGGYDRIAKLFAEYSIKKGSKINLGKQVKKVEVENDKVKGITLTDGQFVSSECVIVTFPSYLAVNQLFDDDVFDKHFLESVNRLNQTTSVIEVHFALSKKIDSRQIVFPVGQNYISKGIFFISNITSSVSPAGEHLMMVGTPVHAEEAKSSKRIREITEKMKNELNIIYPEFQRVLLWERPKAWSLVESVVKKPGLVWKNKMPHEVPHIKGLFFVGDSTVSYGIGTDSAAHSSILCHPKIMSYLKQ